MDGRKLGPSNVLGHTHYPLQFLEAEQLPYQAVMQPDALDGAAVEPFEDLRAHVKSFQSPEGE
jgi:hypothetical protein